MVTLLVPAELRAELEKAEDRLRVVRALASGATTSRATRAIDTAWFSAWERHVRRAYASVISRWQSGELDVRAAVRRFELALASDIPPPWYVVSSSS